MEDFTNQYLFNGTVGMTKNDFYRKILKDVGTTDNVVKFASATFHLVEAPEFKVSIKHS